jgi:hypothetical protein
MLKMKSILRHWIPLAVLSTVICGLVYTAVQQGLRQGANDPQIQIAEDAAAKLSRGDSLASVIPSEKVDIAISLASFVMVYDGEGKVLASSGLLHDQNPDLPLGVLDYTQSHGQDRITWQPEPGVRIATVVAYFNGVQTGYVLVGRSLREVEVRESQTEIITFLAWLVALAATLVTVVFSEFLLAGE